MMQGKPPPSYRVKPMSSWSVEVFESFCCLAQHMQRMARPVCKDVPHTGRCSHFLSWIIKVLRLRSNGEKVVLLQPEIRNSWWTGRLVRLGSFLFVWQRDTTTWTQSQRACPNHSDFSNFLQAQWTKPHHWDCIQQAEQIHCMSANQPCFHMHAVQDTIVFFKECVTEKKKVLNNIRYCAQKTCDTAECSNIVHTSRNTGRCVWGQKQSLFVVSLLFNTHKRAHTVAHTHKHIIYTYIYIYIYIYICAHNTGTHIHIHTHVRGRDEFVPNHA